MKEIFQNRLVRLTICQTVGGIIISPTINGYWPSTVSPILVNFTFMAGVIIMAFGVIQVFKKS